MSKKQKKTVKQPDAAVARPLRELATPGEGEWVPYTVSQIRDDVERLQAVIETFQMLTRASEDEVSLIALQPIANDGDEALKSLGELTTALTQGSWQTGTRITLTFDPEPPDEESTADDEAGAQ